MRLTERQIDALQHDLLMHEQGRPLAHTIRRIEERQARRIRRRDDARLSGLAVLAFAGILVVPLAYVAVMLVLQLLAPVQGLVVASLVLGGAGIAARAVWLKSTRRVR